MLRTRRWTVAAAMALVLTGVEPAMSVLAQGPAGQGKGQAAPPRGGANKKKPPAPPRRRPRAVAPVGQIEMWPMPPALIIRQTPEAHGEINSLLRMLRGG